MEKTLFVNSGAIRGFLGGMAFLVVGGIAAAAFAQTRTIRVVTYNIEDDIDGATTPLPGLIAPSSGGSVTNGGVLEGIGEEVYGGDTNRPIDILTLQETTSNTTTVQPIVDGLNAFYSSRGMSAGYAMSPYQATEEGGDTADGNGPNALVYNTNTLQLIASVGVGTPGGRGVNIVRRSATSLRRPGLRRRRTMSSTFTSAIISRVQQAVMHRIVTTKRKLSGRTWRRYRAMRGFCSRAISTRATPAKPCTRRSSPRG